jgi:5-methylcytosine-specific restriction endonuclease McrA
VSDKLRTHGNRHLKALFRYLDYLAQRPVFRRAAPQGVRQTARYLLPAERWAFKRRLFWKYGGAFCLYCGRSMPLEHLTIDHIQPRSRGGAVRDVTNMALACLGCNREKGNKWEAYTTEP